MTRQYRQRKDDRLITPGASSEEIRCDFAVAPLDRAARAMDEKWGIDQLVGFVSPATAEKYGRAMAHLHAAMDARDPVATADAANNCIRGLHAMDAEAIAAGHKPADPDVMQIEIDGKLYGFARDIDRAERAKRLHPNMVIFTLREAVVALRPLDMGLVADVKHAFPGAEIVALRPRTELEQDLNDEIPW